MRGIVYLISNDVDDQMCVGSTQCSLGKRWREYKCQHKTDSLKICELMRNYGFDKFSIEVIEEVEVSDRSELYWIEGLWQKILIDNGYNLTNDKTNSGSGSGSKQWYADHPDRYKEHLQRQYEKRKEKVNCPICGRLYSKSSLYRHKKLCGKN